MKIKPYIRTVFLLFLFCFLTYACDMFQDEETENTAESTKEVNGTWRVIKASRNGAEITKLMDFSKFTLILKDDNTYTMQNRLPFIVENDGTWSVDDPQYPFRLIFDQTGSTDEVEAMLNYPVVNGTRQISLSFSPGCPSNIYTYVFEKVSN
jgi:hypothetical protein